jgi:methionine biosynthesis protein MetW
MLRNRPDLELISTWIKPNTHVLDLGCGDGALLASLRDTHQVHGYGLEIDDVNIVECIKRRVNVIQTDIDRGLAEFDDNAFDYVVMTQTLQAVHYPERLIDEMLRVGKEGIVTFPNFGHWQSRLQVSLKGRMPVTNALPHEWYNTPNIHMCTVNDFENFCHERNVKIVRRTVVDPDHRTRMLINLFPNMFGSIALYHIQRGK